MGRLRLFFGTDLHGSDRCFRKFLHTGQSYKVDVSIIGGDITGKVIVPIVEQSDGSYKAHFLGVDHKISSTGQLEELEKKIKNTGYYPYRTNEEELKELQSDSSKMDALFDRLMVDRVKEWVTLADDRLKESRTKYYVLPGNDDRFSVDAVLGSSKCITNPEGKVIDIGQSFTMISSGFANITPWNCPRDVPEEELEAKIESMASQVQDKRNCIFNLHCPPVNTVLDQAPKLDENLRVQMGLSGQEMISAGSIAVRKLIEKYQPLLGLHGHIHESKGVANIGRTLCVNPGSEYSEGILRGCIIRLKEDGVESYYFLSG